VIRTCSNVEIAEDVLQYFRDFETALHPQFVGNLVSSQSGKLLEALERAALLLPKVLPDCIPILFSLPVPTHQGAIKLTPRNRLSMCL
jgi:hypothetical protein